MLFRSLGFSDEEVREIIRYYNEAGAFSLDEDETLRAMRPWYDGYCFSEYADVEGHHVFNPDMVLYYLCNYIDEGEPPTDMIDPNTKTDYAKLDRIVRLDKIEGAGFAASFGWAAASLGWAAASFAGTAASFSAGADSAGAWAGATVGVGAGWLGLRRAPLPR